MNIIITKGDDILDYMKDISTKIYDAASHFTKKADCIIKIGEYKIEIKLNEKDIEKRKLYLGDLIYKWYTNDEIEVDNIVKICNEISKLENRIDNIEKKISNLKESIEEG